MSETNAAPKRGCPYCAREHDGVCYLVKAIEYHPDGTVKRVEFKTAHDYSQEVVSVPSAFGVGPNTTIHPLTTTC